MIVFTGLGKFEGFRGQDWFDLRAEIFKNYTLKSLVNQKNKDFILWITFRPEEKDNPTTKKIEQYVKDSGLKYVMTFNGFIYHDDRNLENNKTLEQRLGRSLDTIKGQYGSDEEWVYYTILGSDDMFAENFTELVQNVKPEIRMALYLRKGYIYDCNEKRLADWKNPFSLGNYTIIYPSEVFYDAKKHLLYQAGLESHEQIPEIYEDSKELGEDLYCCCVHGFNISTLWEHPYKGKEYYYEEDKKLILEKFGI